MNRSRSDILADLAHKIERMAKSSRPMHPVEKFHMKQVQLHLKLAKRVRESVR